MAEAKKLKWNEHPIEDDIKYRGKLSYRHFKIIGWALFVLKMVQPLLKLSLSLDPSSANAVSIPLGIIDILAPLSVFFLLMAGFAQLLTRENYAKQMLVNGAAALGIVVVFELLYHRYVVGAVDTFIEDRFVSLNLCNWVFSLANPTGFAAFNIFLDLFLTTSVAFFLNYTPQKYFQGEKLKFFRALVVLPIIYEFVSIGLKVMANSGDFALPITLFPFLTAKPPMMLFVFLIVVVFMKTRESRFCKAGRTHEEYVAYLDTNRSRFDFAKFTALVCLVAGIVDLIIMLCAIFSDGSMNIDALSSMADDAKDILYKSLLNKYVNAGFGGASDLIFFAPVMLLFDYTRTYKDTTIEMAFPLVAVVALVFIYLEAILIGFGIVAPVIKGAVSPIIEEARPILEDPRVIEMMQDGTFDPEVLLQVLLPEVGQQSPAVDSNGSASSPAAPAETTSSPAAPTETSSSAAAPIGATSSEVSLATAA